MKTSLQTQQIAYDSDQQLLRFLRARKFDLEKSIEMFIKHRNWYVQNDIQKYPDVFPHKALALAELVPSAYIGFDREGHPVQIERTGKMDVPTILSAVSGAAMLEGFIWGQQTQIRRCEESCERLGLPANSIERFTQVMDLDGLSSAHMQLAQFLSPITKCGEANFPERMYKTLIVNHGWVFSMIWAIVKLTLDPITREKVIVCGSLEELHKHIDPAQLPVRYGGQLEDPITLNDPDVEALRRKYLNDDKYVSQYQTQAVGSGAHFERQLRVEVGKNYAYCFRASEEIKFKAVFIPDEAASEEEHIQVSVESKIEAQKWPTLGTFASTNGKNGTLVLTWHNDNWWGNKELRYALVEEVEEVEEAAAQ
jgi:hypothetical protein